MIMIIIMIIIIIIIINIIDKNKNILYYDWLSNDSGDIIQLQLHTDGATLIT